MKANKKDNGLICIYRQLDFLHINNFSRRKNKKRRIHGKKINKVNIILLKEIFGLETQLLKSKLPNI